MKRSGFKRKKARTATGHIKGSKVALWASYGLTVPPYVRYAGRKGIYWWLFSRKIRQRDFKKFGGKCIDQCGGVAQSWQEFQAGHFVAAGFCGFGLLFDEMNVHGQLPKCNNPRISPMASIGFARGIDERYGVGTADKLMVRRREINKEWGQVEYDKRIKEMLGVIIKEDL